jgi:F-box protein 9
MEESELEAFRQQWRQEVSARTQASEREPQNDPEPMSTTGQRKAGGPKSSGRRKSTTKPSGTAIVRDENEEAVDSGAYHDLENLDDQRRLGTGDEKIARPGSSAAGQKSLSALDHFEAALEKESQGSLGESLGHYRKAYRVSSITDCKVYLLMFTPRLIHA